MSKYKNKKVNSLDEIFDSKKEYYRYNELVLLQKAGIISDLERQKKFELIPAQKDERAVTYAADFCYIENGKKIAEDCKSVATAKDKAYIIKRKLFKWRFGAEWEFREYL